MICSSALQWPCRPTPVTWHWTRPARQTTTTNLIGEFNLARMDLNNEIGKSERDDARITELNEKVNNLYGQIMGDEGMTAYNEAKRECENLVNYIDAIINTAMNGGDPMTVQEPSASCTGSSTCGGCH